VGFPRRIIFQFKIQIQAVAELYQALEKLELAEPALLSKKRRLSYINKKRRSSSIYKQIDVVFHLPTN
jgi:hypothetical protein